MPGQFDKLTDFRLYKIASPEMDMQHAQWMCCRSNQGVATASA